MISFNTLGNMGRLGNQMFQYAALKGIARNKGYEFCIPPYSMFGKYDGNVKASDATIHIFSNLSPDSVQVTSNTIRHESSFLFDEDLFNSCEDNTDLVGYFQNRKYFKNIEHEIRKEFSFSDEIVDLCNGYIKSVSDEGQLISLHIRRGDYLFLSDCHPPLDILYYENALSKFDESMPVLIFSDDPEWCKSNELFSSDRFLISESNSTVYDLCLMTLCSHHIIANSSFSWWGAWLSGSKHVIAPSKWFGESMSDHDTSDLYCEGWEVI
jgi:hypothetical protein